MSILQFPRFPKFPRFPRCWGDCQVTGAYNVHENNSKASLRSLLHHHSKRLRGKNESLTGERGWIRHIDHLKLETFQERQAEDEVLCLGEIFPQAPPFPHRERDEMRMLQNLDTRRVESIGRNYFQPPIRIEWFGIFPISDKGSVTRTEVNTDYYLSFHDSYWLVH